MTRDLFTTCTIALCLKLTSSQQPFYNLTDDMNSLKMAFDGERKQPNYPFSTQNHNTAQVCLKLSTVNRRFFHWTCSARSPFELNSKRCSRRVREVHSFRVEVPHVQSSFFKLLNRSPNTPIVCRLKPRNIHHLPFITSTAA